MAPSAAEIDGLTDKIISCAIEVHRTLGPGLLESVYRECMMVELKNSHLRAENERHVMLEYKGQRINGTLKLDLLVEECIVME
jgi:GxxExxY protein